MALRDLNSKLQNQNANKRPDAFEFSADSTLHYVSSTYGKPPFSSYKSSFLRSKQPVNPKYLFPEKPTKYLDNPPR